MAPMADDSPVLYTGRERPAHGLTRPQRNMATDPEKAFAQVTFTQGKPLAVSLTIPQLWSKVKVVSIRCAVLLSWFDLPPCDIWSSEF